MRRKDLLGQAEMTDAHFCICAMRILMLEMAGEYDKIYDPATKTYGVDVVEVPGTAIKAEALREDHTVENLADVAGETYGNLGYLSVADWMPAELIH